jgi:hypothetical protein
MAISTAHPRLTRSSSHVRLGVVGAAGFLILAVFQLALALGAPLGAAAYGGTRTELPTGLRIASGVAFVVYCFAALAVLRRGGYQVPLIGDRLARVATWVFAVILTLGALINFASTGEWERFGWGPFTLALGIVCFVVARGHRDS